MLAPLPVHIKAVNQRPARYTEHSNPSQHIMSTGIVTAGVMGVMGNKGGVGIRLRLCSSSLCFVTSHLAAHRDNVRARNDNYLKVRMTTFFYCR